MDIILEELKGHTGDVNCTPPTCPRPTDITIGEINVNDVEISWTDNTAAADNPATEWQVIVQPLVPRLVLASLSLVTRID